MKKIILLFVALGAFTFATAQKGSDKMVSFGVKAGLNVTTITGGELSASSKVGFHVGGLVQFKLTDKFAVQPELLYSTKGAKADYFGSSLEQNLSYVDLPIMAKYFVIEGLSIEAGPQISFLTAAKGKSDGESVDNKASFNSTDFGFNIGAGYELKQGILFQARYNLGFSDISKDDAEAAVNYKEKNNGFQVSVGYRF